MAGHVPAGPTRRTATATAARRRLSRQRAQL